MSVKVHIVISRVKLAVVQQLNPRLILNGIINGVQRENDETNIIHIVNLYLTGVLS